MEGVTLQDRIAGKPIAIEPLLEWAIQLCDALEAAQAKGIVHRNIKPEHLRNRAPASRSEQLVVKNLENGRPRNEAFSLNNFAI